MDLTFNEYQFEDSHAATDDERSATLEQDGQKPAFASRLRLITDCGVSSGGKQRAILS